jgi:hypothetical protein
VVSEALLLAAINEKARIAKRGGGLVQCAVSCPVIPLSRVLGHSGAGSSVLFFPPFPSPAAISQAWRAAACEDRLAPAAVLCLPDVVLFSSPHSASVMRGSQHSRSPCARKPLQILSADLSLRSRSPQQLIQLPLPATPNHLLSHLLAPLSCASSAYLLHLVASILRPLHNRR